MSTKLSDIGERRLIEIIRSQYKYRWSDDDAAEIENGNNYTIITTDSISEKSHMPKGASLESVGDFFAALNLSDIAAMGGTPKYFMAALTLPKNMNSKELIQLEKGMGRCLERYDVKLIGGDLKQGTEMTLTGIAIGEVSKKGILRRNGIKRNDVLCVTGRLGKNAAAYSMWKKTGRSRWAQMLVEIEPRIKAGRLISDYGATSAIDLSDGVFSAISQLSKINKIGFLIDYSKIPIHSIAKKVSKQLGLSLEELALNFGGEYELLFTVPRKKLAKLKINAKINGIEISEIGIAKGTKNFLVKNGASRQIIGKGYEHFTK